MLIMSGFVAVANELPFAVLQMSPCRGSRWPGSCVNASILRPGLALAARIGLSLSSHTSESGRVMPVCGSRRSGP